MPDESDIRYVYRFWPISDLIQWFTWLALVAGMAICFWKLPIISVPFSAASLVISIRILFLQTRILIARSDGLLLIKQPLLRRFGSSQFVPVADILHMRYWSEIYEVQGEDSTTKETRYALDLLKRNGERLTLLTSDILPIPPKLGRTLAHHLAVNYEEYLA